MSHWEARALQLHNEITILWQNNLHNRYAEKIKEKQKELDEILERIRKEK